MADSLINIDDNAGSWIPVKVKDLGDGTYGISVRNEAFSSEISSTIVTSSSAAGLATEINNHLSGSTKKLHSISVSALGTLLSGVTFACINEY